MQERISLSLSCFSIATFLIISLFLFPLPRRASARSRKCRWTRHACILLVCISQTLRARTENTHRLGSREQKKKHGQKSQKGGDSKPKMRSRSRYVNRLEAFPVVAKQALEVVLFFSLSLIRPKRNPIAQPKHQANKETT